MTYSLELTVTMIDGSQQFDFCQIDGDGIDTREKAIEIHKSNLLSRIKKAQAGNKIWANHKDNYAEWLDFLLV